MEFKIVIEECEEGGYTASVPFLPGCISEGDTYEETIENIKGAVNLYLRAVTKETDLLRSEKRRVVEVAV
ncbi:type II toxin-antitoxin system HicB family antitoxin [bacterium]|nr:type II toxin-antitoxin system HicB family antitoxin [bacterium]MBU1615692.1 type II toxin-antitoxin system HicB family antitoxin [bacterium]